MENIIIFVVGFILGVITVALAIELGMKKTPTSEPSSRVTQYWSIAEITNPRIVAEHLGDDVDIPKNAKLVVNNVSDEAKLKNMAVKQHSGVKGNFILGDDRALLLAGPIQKNEIGVWTVEKEILSKLNTYFDKSWQKATTMKSEPSKKKS